MENKSISLDADIQSILRRIDASSQDALIASLAGELQRLEQLCVTLAARLSALEVSQTYYHRVVAPNEPVSSVALPRSVTIDAAFNLPNSGGFYAVEYEPSGTPFRWTGPQPTFYFELMIDRQGPAHLTLMYRRIFAVAADAQVGCLVDGQPVATSVHVIEGGFEVRAMIPPRGDPGATVVMFVCPRVESPADWGKGGDTRKLGLAFRQLRIEPAPEAARAAVRPADGQDGPRCAATERRPEGTPTSSE